LGLTRLGNPGNWGILIRPNRSGTVGELRKQGRKIHQLDNWAILSHPNVTVSILLDPNIERKNATHFLICYSFLGLVNP
jgi:hypothetical protein